MEEKYAQTLLKLAAAGVEPGDAVVRVNTVLEKEGRVGLWPKIKRAFIRLVQSNRQKENATLVLSDESKKSEIEKSIGISLVGASVTKDESIIGGWVYKKGSQLVDASYKTQLKRLYTQATK